MSDRAVEHRLGEQPLYMVKPTFELFHRDQYPGVGCHGPDGGLPDNQLHGRGKLRAE